MKITLAQAIPLRSSISNRIQELVRERRNVSIAEAEKGENYEKPVRTMEQVTVELEEARNDFRTLDVAVAKENLTNTIQWDERSICITEALELSKQIRGEANEHKQFGDRKKQQRKQGGWNNESLIEFALYEPEKYRLSAIKIKRVADRLSNEIERVNHQVEFEFEGAERYI